MTNNPESVPYVSVRPNSVSFFNLPESQATRSDAQKASEIHLEDNDHRGLISAKAKRRISLGIDWLLYLSNDKFFTSWKNGKRYKFRVNFVTLTLASKQVHSDQVIKKQLLNQFLIECGVCWGVKHYLWRAEPQDNGNIHFHILTDNFIPWNELRNRWNRIQDKLGYLQRSKHYKAGWQPNSTDVHSVRKVRKLSAYLAKYCTKESTGRKIEGKQWGLSNSISKMKSAVDLRCSEVVEDLARLYRHAKDKMKEYDYCTVYWISSEMLKELECWKLVDLLEEYVVQVQEKKDYI